MLALLSRLVDTIVAEDYQVSVSIDEPKSLFPLPLDNYYVHVPSLSSQYVLPSGTENREEKKATKPIIVLSATYDAFAVAPVPSPSTA